MTARAISLESISKTTIFLTLVLASLCYATNTGDWASVAAGGAFSVLNLHLIRLLVSRLMTPAATGLPLSRVVAIKLLVLLSVVAVALKRLPLDAVSFLVGAGALFVAIVLEAVLLGEPVAGSGDG